MSLTRELVESTVQKTIKESTENAAKKGITQSVDEAIEKAVKESLNESILDGTQKAVKEAIEKNVDVVGKLKGASDNLKAKMRVDPDVKSSMFSKLPTNMKQFLTSQPGLWDNVYEKSINNTDFDKSFRELANKNITLGELSSKTTSDFKVKSGQEGEIKSSSKNLSKELDADPEYKEKSLTERKESFDKLERGEANLDDANLKPEIKKQGRGLFRASKSTIAATIAAVAFFAWQKKKADDINNWNGRCTRIEVTNTQIKFLNLQEFPDDDVTSCTAREYSVLLSTHNLTLVQGGSGSPLNINCTTYNGPPINGSDSNNFIYDKSSFGNCFNNINVGLYDVIPAIDIKCKTSAGKEAGCTIKRYGFEPFKDVFDGLGINLGKIIRTILIVIGVVILAIVIFKIIGFVRNRNRD